MMYSALCSVLHSAQESDAIRAHRFVHIDDDDEEAQRRFNGAPEGLLLGDAPR